MTEMEGVGAQLPVLAPAGRADDDDARASPLTRAQKAAIIISAVGGDLASEVLGELSVEGTRRFAVALSSLHSVTFEQVDRVIGEFLATLHSRAGLRGGPAEVRRILGSILDPEDVDRLMDEIGDPLKGSVWTRLGQSPQSAVAAFLKGEHPQTVALALSRMRTDRAARILDRFDRGFAQEVVLRMGSAPRVDVDVVKVMEKAIDRQFFGELQREGAGRKPVEVIGQMLNHVSPAARARMIERRARDDPALVEKVQRVMFTFLDIPDRTPPRAVSGIVKEAGTELLVRAFKNAEAAEAAVAEFFFSNLSKRMSERLREDVENGPDAHRRETEEAQTELVQTVQAMARRGVFDLIEPEGEED